MYLKQMGQVPLLTREQEVRNFKANRGSRASGSAAHQSFWVYRARAHLDLAQKLAEGHERFDRVILDKKIESRERYMKLLPRLCQKVEKLGEINHAQYAQIAARFAHERRGRKRSRVRSIPATALSAILFQTKGDGRIRPSGRSTFPAFDGVKSERLENITPVAASTEVA